MTSLYQVLDKIRKEATNETEKGYAFERLVKIFLENDAIQKQQYSQVWHYKDWAKEHPDYASMDVGIDLVAKIRDEDTYCAIQCKFYQENNPITKADLDSFISASATNDFTRLLLIDTSTKGIGSNATSVLKKLNKQWQRIPSSELDGSRINWMAWHEQGKINLTPPKEIKDHQIKALQAVREGLSEDDRGKLIMACGTGKTFTSLKIAEDLTGANGIVGLDRIVLYMVPSLALMSQTIREWKNDAKDEFVAFSACSDEKVGRRRAADDRFEVSLHELAFPATTDAKDLAEEIKKTDKGKMIVVFSTYHSINVISKAQSAYNLPTFDLIICDEAHRTTGATFTGDDESNFVKIHSNNNVKGKKRLYMTATPKIYGEIARQREDRGDVALASMDDDATFGKTLFHKGFSWAVENNLLTDYKVVVLMMDEQVVSNNVQKLFAEGSELKLDDVTKMVGCYKALAKIGITKKNGKIVDSEPMKRALAFFNSIAFSKMFANEFKGAVKEYLANENIPLEHKTNLDVELHHVDGTFNAERRSEELNWLKNEPEENTCRILTNARCLSEGIDVPALDAIIFVHPRKSQIDVVQTVGRVMRKAEGKNMGYVIIPIPIAPGVTAEKALDDNERYKVIWQILNALRAHDERFDSTINRIKLGEDVSDKIEIIDSSGISTANADELNATTAVIEDVLPRTKHPLKKKKVVCDDHKKEDGQLNFTITELSQAIKAKIVEKCGTRDYWEKWAGDIAKIAEQHITRIKSIVLNTETEEHKTFQGFLAEVRDDLNPSITETDAVEMLAQHIITRPVFDVLFQGNKFTAKNAVSKAMETVLAQIYRHQIEAESKSLENFYASIKRRSEGVSAKGRQTLILELYDRFFRKAFPLMTQKLGIVYTPVEIVDFIIHSVSDVVKNEFGLSLGSKDVHILDPFAGTGTFISRLLLSGLLTKDEIKKKFKSEIHANEIVLLAYYIACINIETVYHDLVEEEEYQPFDGMVLTDTFQLYEQEKDMIANLMPDNSGRRTRQKERDIKIVVGNPPYSVGQTSENDNAKNLKYPNLDKRIKETYVVSSNSTNKNALYDSYIRAFRWATDRIGDEGVIGFITNAGWMERNTAVGVREHLEKEFSKIYLFHLRGDARLSGEAWKKEGGKIFGQGSRTPIAITILVKKKDNDKKAQIFFHDIGDYLDRESKLALIQDYKSINGMIGKEFRRVRPNTEKDWINQRVKDFRKHIPLRSETGLSIFSNSSLGIQSSGDAWAYNFSKINLASNITYLIKNYNSFLRDNKSLKDKDVRDGTKIKWSSSLKQKFDKKKHLKFDYKKIGKVNYRPFTSSHLYLCEDLIHRKGVTPTFIKSKEDLVIAVTGKGANYPFSCLMFNRYPNYDSLNKAQCFPLVTYQRDASDEGLETDKLDGMAASRCNEGISDEALEHFRNHYNEKKISKKDIFFYVYGILHSEEYRTKYANNLTKETPRIPLVHTLDDFKSFSKMGKRLAHLHVNFEEAEKYPIAIKEGDLRLITGDNPEAFFRVKKMKFADKEDKSTVVYNNNITIQNIPLEAYEYVVNGKPALEWVMDRQCVKEDRASGIVNDANKYANEAMNNPAYPLELFQRVITISLETMKIVKALPKLF